MLELKVKTDLLEVNVQLQFNEDEIAAHKGMDKSINSQNYQKNQAEKSNKT
jgi:hypothetical protein